MTQGKKEPDLFYSMDFVLLCFDFQNFSFNFRCYDVGMNIGLNPESSDISKFTPNQPREKWIKKRTSVKIR